MKKNFITFFVLVFLLAGTGVGIFYFKQSLFKLSSVTTESPVITPAQTPTRTPPQKNLEKSFSVISSTGQKILTLDFLKNSETAQSPFNKGYYHLGFHDFVGRVDPTSSSTMPYDIEYIDKDKTFTIALLKKPIMETRRSAQEYLTKYLGISEEEMCRLKYTIVAPYNVGDLFGGFNLGFSFCSTDAVDGRTNYFVNEFTKVGGSLGVSVCKKGESEGCVKFGDTNPDTLGAILELQSLCRKQNNLCQLVLTGGNEPSVEEISILGTDVHPVGEAIDIRTNTQSDTYFKKLFTITDSALVTANPKTKYQIILPSGAKILAYHTDSNHWHIQITR